MNLEQFWPHARPWVENLANTFPGKYVKPQFAWWEVGHVLSLITLGGTTTGTSSTLSTEANSSSVKPTASARRISLTRCNADAGY